MLECGKLPLSGVIHISTSKLMRFAPLLDAFVFMLPGDRDVLEVFVRCLDVFSRCCKS